MKAARAPWVKPVSAEEMKAINAKITQVAAGK